MGDMRDKFGRFTTGHIPENPRDVKTGRFTKKPLDQHTLVALEVDKMLRSQEGKRNV